MNTGQRVTVACCSLVALMLLVASSPLGGYARSAAFAGIQPDSPALKHYNIPAWGFRPPNGADIHSFNYPACVWEDSILHTLAAPLMLPEGSIIKYITLFYYDSAIQDVHMYLDVISGPDSVGQVAHVQSSGSAGLGSSASDELSIPVDMATNAYALEVSMPEEFRSNQLCGARVDYIPPSIFAVALPHVAR